MLRFNLHTLCRNKYVLFIVMVLVICIISFVHIRYNLNLPLKILVLQANVDFEKSLCDSKIMQKKSDAEQRYRSCPQTGFVTVSQGGRLGNQVWEYASALAYARQHGLEVYVPRCIWERLEALFENLTVPALDEIAHCPINFKTFVKSMDKWNNTSQSIVLSKCIVLMETVLTWIKDVNQEFTIRKELREKADNILRLANKQQHKLPVYVAIHVRRTDYTAYLWPKHHIRFVSAKYFYNAMDYFEQKYQPVVFVVVSDDPSWCAKQLTQKPNVYIVGEKTSPEQDLAVMAACNHSIIDYGTYGIWGAFQAGGETIAYNLTKYPTTTAAKRFPNWHVLS